MLSICSCLSFQKERDLELAAKIGQTLLHKNEHLVDKNEVLEETLSHVNEKVTYKNEHLVDKNEVLEET